MTLFKSITGKAFVEQYISIHYVSSEQVTSLISELENWCDDNNLRFVDCYTNSKNKECKIYEYETDRSKILFKVIATNTKDDGFKIYTSTKVKLSDTHDSIDSAINCISSRLSPIISK